MSEQFSELISQLANGLSHCSLYGTEHPRVRTLAESVASGLRDLLRGSDKDLFFLGIVQGRLVDEGRFLVGSTLLGRRLVELGNRHHCGGFLFRAGLDADELCRFLSASCERVETADLAESRAHFASRGVTSIELSPPYEDPAWFGQFLYSRDGISFEGGASTELIQVYQDMFEAVEVAHANAERDSAIDVQATRSASEDLLRTADGDFSNALQLVRYPDYDSYTVGHSVRVALLAVMVATELEMPHEFLIEIGAAGLLHDIGKAKVPGEILFKRGQLDDEERRVMSRHPADGAAILIENEDVGPLGIAAAYGHHIRRDGRGYPPTPSWFVRSQVTDVVHACDVFEALTAVRPYKPSFTPRRAFEIMVQDRGAFDPAALTALVHTVGFYPPGSRLALSNGRGATALRAGPDPALPRIRLDGETDGALEMSHPDMAGVTILGLTEEIQPRSPGEDNPEQPSPAPPDVSGGCGTCG